MKGTCDVCERVCDSPSSRELLTGHSVFMCKACWAIWYDGTTETDEIKKHSLHWPTDSYGAYAKSHYGEKEFVDFASFI